MSEDDVRYRARPARYRALFLGYLWFMTSFGWRMSYKQKDKQSGDISVSLMICPMRSRLQVMYLSKKGGQ